MALAIQLRQPAAGPLQEEIPDSGVGCVGHRGWPVACIVRNLAAGCSATLVSGESLREKAQSATNSSLALSCLRLDRHVAALHVDALICLATGCDSSSAPFPSPTQTPSPTPRASVTAPRPAAEADSLADAITRVYGKAGWYSALLRRAGRPDVQISITPSKKTYTVFFRRLDDMTLARTICLHVAALLPSVPSAVRLSAEGSTVTQCPGPNG